MLGMLNNMPNGGEPIEVRVTRLETQVPYLDDRLIAVTASLDKLRWALWFATVTALIAVGAGVSGSVTGMVQTVSAAIG